MSWQYYLCIEKTSEFVYLQIRAVSQSIMILLSQYKGAAGIFREHLLPVPLIDRNKEIIYFLEDSIKLCLWLIIIDAASRDRSDLNNNIRFSVIKTTCQQHILTQMLLAEGIVVII